MIQEGGGRAQQLEQLYPERTGKNGYEKYIAAAAQAYRSQFGPLRTQQEAGRAVAGEFHKSIKPIFDLVAAGNRQPAFRPGTLHHNTLLPELPAFKLVAFGLSQAAAFEFANGAYPEGVSMITEGSHFSDRLDQSIIAFLVGTANQSFFFKEIQSALHKLPSNELARLEALATTRLKSMKSLSSAWKGDDAQVIESIRAASADAKGFVESGVPDSAVSRNYVIFATKYKSNLLQTIQRIQADQIARAKKFERMLSGPESTWSKEYGISEDNIHFDKDKLINFFPTTSTKSIAAVFARTRTQWRLVRLATRVETWQRKQGALPKSLQEAAPSAWTQDPLSGQAFKYSRKSSKEYDLYSVGGLGSGRVDIVYKRPKRT